MYQSSFVITAEASHIREIRTDFRDYALSLSGHVTSVGSIYKSGRWTRLSFTMKETDVDVVFSSVEAGKSFTENYGTFLQGQFSESPKVELEVEAGKEGSLIRLSVPPGYLYKCIM
jgi:hypothetical protein